MVRHLEQLNSVPWSGHGGPETGLRAATKDPAPEGHREIPAGLVIAVPHMHGCQEAGLTACVLAVSGAAPCVPFVPAASPSVGAFPSCPEGGDAALCMADWITYGSALAV